MNDFFRRQLVYYAQAHRDHVNGVMHIIGNPIIFIGVVLPLCLVPVTVLGVQVSLAPLLVIPALLLWTIWDIALGLAIVAASIPLLFIATTIASNASVVWAWIISVTLFVLGWVLQIVGHQVFEGQRPTLLDNPVQCSSARCTSLPSSSSHLVCGPISRRFCKNRRNSCRSARRSIRARAAPI